MNIYDRSTVLVTCYFVVITGCKYFHHDCSVIICIYTYIYVLLLNGDAIID